MNFKVGDRVAVKPAYTSPYDTWYRPLKIDLNKIYTVTHVKTIWSEPHIRLNGVSGMFVSGTYFELVYPTPTKSKEVTLKFDEAKYLLDLEDYIKNTYSQHYAASKPLQTAELIYTDPERGLAYTLGNIIKYADRFGKKCGKNKTDLQKIAHYAIHAMYCLDKQKQEENKGE
ncbi:DUF3310 domain-containing protein [Zooshikella sp. RANM57]|uniref:DUF3310 domain-containing protein n=1 Tax=Zooshikella sp. RANM57 TaxID=3425863 RepID=UPI003D6EE73F